MSRHTLGLALSTIYLSRRDPGQLGGRNDDSRHALPRSQRGGRLPGAGGAARRRDPAAGGDHLGRRGRAPGRRAARPRQRRAAGRRGAGALAGAQAGRGDVGLHVGQLRVRLPTAPASRWRAIEPALGVPASSTSIAFVEALRAPRDPPGRGRGVVPSGRGRPLRRPSSADGGIEVVALGSHGIITAAEVGTLAGPGGRDGSRRPTTRTPRRCWSRTPRCTRWPWLDELEAAVGKPVLTANQVTVWQGLRARRAGRADRRARARCSHDRLTA